MIEIRACAADFARIVAAENAQNPGFRQYGLVLSAAIRIGATTKNVGNPGNSAIEE